MHDDDDLTGLAELRVLHDVRVLSVAVSGLDILVDVYGSEAHVCGSVRFSVPARLARAATVRTLRGWARRDVPLTFSQHRGRASLTHLESLVR